MALEVEDGTRKSNAEAYISVAGADAYFSIRGNAAWALLTTPAKEQALRKAADYMEAMYSQRWQGTKASQAQALSWPRFDVSVDGYAILSNVVPVAVQRANAELASRASVGDLLGDLGAQVRSETVGPISVTYADGARQVTRYALVENILAALLASGLRMVQVARA